MAGILDRQVEVQDRQVELQDSQVEVEVVLDRRSSLNDKNEKIIS